MDLNTPVDKLEQGVAKAKIALANADAAAQKNQIRPEHWDKLAQGEQAFLRSLTKIDEFIPMSSRGGFDILGSQIKVLAIFAAIFLIGSTATLWFLTREKPKKRPRVVEDEYEYVEE